MLEVLDAMCGGSKVKRKNVFNGLARWQWEQNLVVSDTADGEEVQEQSGVRREARYVPPAPTARGH